MLDDLVGEFVREAEESADEPLDLFDQPASVGQQTRDESGRPCHRIMTMSAETAVTIVAVSVGTAHADVLDSPSERELDAVIGAAVWYAKYHERIITELADDRSALAVSRRDRYQQLYNGLAKLGVRLRRPEGVDPAP